MPGRVKVEGVVESLTLQAGGRNDVDNASPGPTAASLISRPRLWRCIMHLVSMPNTPDTDKLVAWQLQTAGSQRQQTPARSRQLSEAGAAA